MFERLEAKIEQRDKLRDQLKNVRKYFEDIFNGVANAHHITKDEEWYWDFQYPPFKHNGHDYIIVAATKPTNEELEKTQIRLTIWPKDHKEDSEEEWLPQTNNISESDRERLSKIMPDLEIIVKALKRLPGLRPGYL